ncbi:MAG: hypothetical protein L3J91_00925, partial [Thermoplasmata archaeon]|nr:hypothetical protein [Thermoplasmata archaeon]
MADGSDAESIRRERAERRSQERLRIERDRTERDLELARLRRAELLADREARDDGRRPRPTASAADDR